MAILIHLCNLILSAQHQSMSIAIIAMVNHTDQSNHSSISTKEYRDATTDTGIPSYEWSPEMQGFLLSVNMFGIMITTIPTGYFAGVLGGKKIVGLALLISSVLNLLVPLAADYGLPYLCLIRIIQGLSQGMSSGALPAFWPKWAPPLERTQLIIIGLAGTTMGSFIGVIVGGFLCEYPGWPSIFYIFGGFGCVYSIVWFFLVYDDPLNHPLISANEKEYIISSIIEQVNYSHWSLPFKAIIKSLPFWAIIIPAICRFWLVSNLTISLPTLLNNMFDINIQTNGFLSALPLITSWITMTLGSHTADFLLSKKVFTLIRVRKLFTFLGEWQERRTRSGGYRRHKVHKRHRRHRMRGHSCQLGANQKLGAHREREARHEETDQRASFPGCEFEHGEAAAGSGHAGSSGAEVLCGRAGLAPPSSPCSVPEPSQDVQDAPRRPELAADCQRCHKRPCRWAAWEEQELGPSCSYPHLGPYEWSCGRSGPTSPCQLAAGCQMCHGSPCHWPVWVKLELWPSRSFYPDLGPCEWSWGGRGSTCRCPEHCPTCCPAHRF
uniref:Major facilitator superfamily (MFS) profile domain-containing protein n=1 Tax=Sarcophilus harrisii TaxID=9305 RepID=G3VSB4_SARHA